MQSDKFYFDDFPQFLNENQIRKSQFFNKIKKYTLLKIRYCNNKNVPDNS